MEFHRNNSVELYVCKLTKCYLICLNLFKVSTISIAFIIRIKNKTQKFQFFLKEKTVASHLFDDAHIRLLHQSIFKILQELGWFLVVLQREAEPPPPALRPVRNKSKKREPVPARNL